MKTDHGYSSSFIDCFIIIENIYLFKLLLTMLIIVCIEHVSQEKLEKALHQFTGRIMQTPPAYSALKRGGVRMSDLVK